MTNLATFGISTVWPQLVAGYCAVLLPLVAGLPPIIAIMESTYVMTEREIWRQLARFWSLPFRISLVTAALGAVALLIRGVVDALGPGSNAANGPGLALVASILVLLCVEIGLFMRFNRDDWIFPNLRHLANTWLLVAVPALALLGVAIVYGWLDNPVGLAIDDAGTRLHVVDVPQLLLNPAAQVKFVHLAGTTYVTAAGLVLATSAWYLLHHRNVKFARCSLTVAASFGLAAALSTAVLGDATGYAASPAQRMKVAAIAAEWRTREPPAALTLVGWPDEAARTTHAALRVPWLLGLAATHSWRKPLPGIDELRAANVERVRTGIAALPRQAAGPEGPNVGDAGQRAAEASSMIGYGLLALRHGQDPSPADAAVLAAAARDTIPNVPLLFWSFRGMVLSGLYGIALFGCAFWLASRRRLDRRWLLRAALWSLPVPWLAGALGWIVNEAGRGPWLVAGVLPVPILQAGWWVPTTFTVAGLALACLVIVGVSWTARVLRDGPEGLRYWAADPEKASRH